MGIGFEWMRSEYTSTECFGGANAFYGTHICDGFEWGMQAGRASWVLLLLLLVVVVNGSCTTNKIYI